MSPSKTSAAHPLMVAAEVDAVRRATLAAHNPEAAIAERQRPGEAETTLELPDAWDVEVVQMKVNVKRVWIPLSHTTAMLLAAVLEHRGMGVDAWVADKAIADAETPSGSTGER